MELIELKNGIWQVVNLSNEEILHEGTHDSCEDYMLSIQMYLTGI